MAYKQTALFLVCVAALAPAAWCVQKSYGTGQIVSLQQKTRTKVDMYLVNTPVGTAVPYFEITIQLGSVEYIAEFTPRHEDEELPAEWRAGASVLVRSERHYLFVKRSEGDEVKWVITKQSRVKQSSR